MMQHPMALLPDIIGTARYQSLVGDDEMTIGPCKLRAVLPPLPRPLQTASGQLTHAPIVLVDLEMSSGVSGASYLFSPRTDMLKPLMQVIHAIAATLAGSPCDPVAISAQLDRQFLLFGGTGLVTMARAALDMALWDALGKQKAQPLFRLLGGSAAPIPAYESSGLGLSTVKAVTDEATRFVQNGFDTMKLRLGYPDVSEDIQVLEALRHAVGPGVKLMVDYNQALSLEQAQERCHALDSYGLLWIEEPIRADDLEGAAALTAQIKTPIQIGENLFSPLEAARAMALKSSTYLMPDVMKIGGVSNWLIVAEAAARQGIPVSSHLFPEVSAHLLATAPNRHFLEYANWTEAILRAPLVPIDGSVILPETPGTGIAWNESAVARYLISD